MSVALFQVNVQNVANKESERRASPSHQEGHQSDDDRSTDDGSDDRRDQSRVHTCQTERTLLADRGTAEVAFLEGRCLSQGCRKISRKDNVHQN